MFKGYRNGTFGFGLAVGLFVAAILCVAYDQLYGLVQCVADAKCDTDSHSNKQSDEDDWRIWSWSASRSLVSSSDTLAQWIMAVFSIAAVGLIWRTLSQTNKTNRAAVRAANAASEANNIMRNEQRPWLVLNRDVFCEFSDLGDRGEITWNYDFENKGKSPAYDIALNYTLIKRAHYQHMRMQLEQYLQHVFSTRRLTGMSVIFPGEKSDFIKYYSGGGTIYQGDDFSVGDFSDDGHIMMMACLTYRISQDSEFFGYDVRMFDIEPPKRWAGPWAHKMLEHAEQRLIG